MAQAAKERRLAFDTKVPNATTRKAIEQLEKGKRPTPAHTLVEFFGRSPLRGVSLKIERSRDTGRKPVRF